MQEDRASWWFFLPILVLVMGVVPAGAIQNLLDGASRAHVEARVVPGGTDSLLPQDVAPPLAAVESGLHKQQREIRIDMPALLPAVSLAFEYARRLPVRAGMPPPAHERGSTIYQFHTLSLQL